MPRLADRRARIELLRAAEAAFTERGLAAARVEDITERAGVSKGAFYLHFQSKDDCFKQIVGYDHGLAWPAGATPERFAPVPRQNERAACAYFGGHIYIARFIAYDVRPGEVYPVIARRIDQHTGARLAALAPLSINLVAYFRMMRAIIYSVYSRAVERQLSRQSVVDLAEGLFRVKRASYAGLVSDNDGLHARLVDQAQGFGCPRVDD